MNINILVHNIYDKLDQYKIQDGGRWPIINIGSSKRSNIKIYTYSSAKGYFIQHFKLKNILILYEDKIRIGNEEILYRDITDEGSYFQFSLIQDLHNIELSTFQQLPIIYDYLDSLQ